MHSRAHVTNFPAAPASIAAARQFAVDVVSPTHPGLCDEVRLMVSELATNAIRHGRSDYAVNVESRPTGVRVEVSDLGACWPAVSSADPAAGSPAGWSAGWSADWPAGWSADWPAGRPAGWPAGWTAADVDRPAGEGGRGLRIVDVIADAWGVLPTPDALSGTTVWFELRSP